MVPLPSGHILNIYVLLKIKFKVTNHLFDALHNPTLFFLLVEMVLFILYAYITNPIYIQGQPYVYRPTLALTILYHASLFWITYSQKKITCLTRFHFQNLLLNPSINRLLGEIHHHNDTCVLWLRRYGFCVLLHVLANLIVAVLKLKDITLFFYFICLAVGFF